VGNVIWKFFLSSPTAFDTITSFVVIGIMAGLPLECEDIVNTLCILAEVSLRPEPAQNYSFRIELYA
jgi:hypothetical protein